MEHDSRQEHYPKPEPNYYPIPCVILGKYRAGYGPNVINMNRVFGGYSHS